MHVAADAVQFMKGNTIFVMGCGRSGTSILGMLLGTMRPAFFVSEPVLLRLLGPIMAKRWHDDTALAIVTTLFEDYILPLVQARRVDPVQGSFTHTKDLESPQETLWRMRTLNPRRRAVIWMMCENPMFIIKLPEMQPFAHILKKIIPDSRFIHIIRDGRDCVSSATIMPRDWHTDEWYKSYAVEWLKGAPVGRPYYVDIDNKTWNNWNAQTRAACSWRCSVQAGLDLENKENIPVNRIIYEQFKQDIYKYTEDLASSYNLRLTSRTYKLVESIAEYKQRSYNYPLSIKEPELSRFNTLRKELGYA